jgi:hypothetical protein
MKANVIPFSKKETQRQRVNPPTDPKYFTERQIRLRGRTVTDSALLGASKGPVSPIREWMIVDMLITTALRFPEAANLRSGDAKSSCGRSAVFVTAQCVLCISLCVLSQSFSFLLVFQDSVLIF